MKKITFYSFLATLFLFFHSPQFLFSQSPLFEEVSHDMKTFDYASSDVGDFDGDGFLDIIMCGAIDTNNSGNPDTTFCQLYRNNNGVFEEVQNFSVISKHLGDVSFVNGQNNGLLDIVITGQDYDNLAEYFTYFYRNTGNGFELAHTFPGYIFSEIKSADLNLNGRMDLIINGRSSNATYGPEAVMFENLGDFDFDRQELPVEATWMMGNMKLVDVNNDNLVDLVLMGMDATTAPVFNIYLNTGDGFELHQSLDGATFGSLNYADFNADGYQDLVIAGTMGSSKALRVYWNDGNGNFTDFTDLEIPVSNNSGTQSIGAGDINNDGYYDIVVFGENASSVQKSYIYTYNHNTNDFDLYEEPTGLLDIGSSANVQLLDFNNDNSLDILVSGLGMVSGTLKGVTKLYKNNSSVSNQAPTPPTDLEVTEDGEFYVFEWEGASDDRTPYAALRYEIRIGSESGAEDLAKYQITTPSWKIKREALPAEGFAWAVKSIDASQAHSQESDEAIFGSLGTSKFEQELWTIFPNPSSDFVTIQGKNIRSLSIYSIDGKLVQNEEINNRENSIISIESLQSGVYVIELMGSNGEKIRKKLIKE